MERNSRGKTSRKVEYILWEDIAYSLFYLEHKIHIFLLIFSCQVITNSFQFRGPRHARLPCPPLTPRACSDSCPLSWWCYLAISSYLTISSSTTPSSCCLQVFLASGAFSVSQLFASCGQIIGASASVLPVNIQSWFPLGLTGLISFLSKALSRVFSSVTVWKHQFFSTQSSLWSNFHICTWLLEKP